MTRAHTRGPAARPAPAAPKCGYGTEPSVKGAERSANAAILLRRSGVVRFPVTKPLPWYGSEVCDR